MSSYHTKQEIRMAWRCSASVLPPVDLVIPAGTRCSKINEGGTAGKFWVEDLAWFPKDMPTTRHDAVHYGIVLEAEQVEDLDANRANRDAARKLRPGNVLDLEAGL